MYSLQFVKHAGQRASAVDVPAPCSLLNAGNCGNVVQTDGGDRQKLEGRAGRANRTNIPRQVSLSSDRPLQNIPCSMTC